MSALKIACVGDVSNHGGVIITSNQDGRLKLGGVEVAVENALHVCPIEGHGTQVIHSVINRVFYNGKLVLTEDAVVAAPCGATIMPVNRRAFIGAGTYIDASDGYEVGLGSSKSFGDIY